MYGIYRIDDDTHHTHAWKVKLCRQGKVHFKNFPDKKSGGKGKALRLAKQYRDQLIVTYPPTTRKEFASVLRPNNTSGVVGVCLVNPYYTLRDGTRRDSWCWEAIWPTERGGKKTVRYSINKWGKKQAFDKACKARRRGLAQVEGVFWASSRGERTETRSALIKPVGRRPQLEVQFA